MQEKPDARALAVNKIYKDLSKKMSLKEAELRQRCIFLKDKHLCPCLEFMTLIIFNFHLNKLLYHHQKHFQIDS